KAATPEPTPKPVSAPAAQPIAQPVAKPIETPPGPAATVTCQTCATQLDTQGAGAYVCPRCLATFSIGSDGAASFLPRPKFVPVQLSLTPAPECVDGLYAFVGSLAQKAGFPRDRVMAIQGVVKETANAIGELAYANNPQCVYHVSMAVADSSISITFSDTGKKIDPAAVSPAGKEYFGITRRTMDAFKITQGPRGGNVVSLVKENKP
ncbi:MAG: hypothetical protein RDV41_13845, partial [Planctomycetota bacterium]|nr:hypothetical protein [Planctomycetota bacterium]